jgi:hypothetical protein
LGRPPFDSAQGRLYRDLEAVVLWGLGARAADLQGVRGVGRSSLYEHLAALLGAPPALAEPLADAAAELVTLPVTPIVASRIVELLVGQGLDAAGIAAQLAAQDGTQVSAAVVQSYLQQAGLADDRGSAWPRPALPAPEPAPVAGVFTIGIKLSASRSHSSLVRGLRPRLGRFWAALGGGRSPAMGRRRCSMNI